MVHTTNVNSLANKAVIIIKLFLQSQRLYLVAIDGYIACYTHTCIHTNAHILTHTCTHHTCTYTCACVRTHVHECTCLHTHTHAHTHAHTHTHTRYCNPRWWNAFESTQKQNNISNMYNTIPYSLHRPHSPQTDQHTSLYQHTHT